MLQSLRSALKYIWPVLAFLFIAFFIFADSSGISQRGLTQGTTIARVNGENITYEQWNRAVEQRIQQLQQQQPGAVTLDDRRRVEEEVFQELVNDVLLQQEYRRRGITVTDREIIEAARYLPHPMFMQSPEFQTEGRFDPEKYQRYLASPQARREGVLAFLEQYYRSELPRQKLFERIASTAVVSDQEMWWIYQVQNDSAQVSYVAWPADQVADTLVQVTDAEIQTWWRTNQRAFRERPGRAVVSVVSISRAPTAADTAATVERAAALRSEIVAGQRSFDDAARDLSADTMSAVQGGGLGRGGRGRFVPEFEQAAYALRPGEISQPVRTAFGVHLIRVDARQGDTLDLRHILLRYQQSDTAAAETDRLADRLDRLAAGATDRARFDTAARELNLPVQQVTVFENDPVVVNGSYAPGVSAWAFGGAAPGETSDVFDSDEGYFLARLESVQHGGRPALNDVSEEIRSYLAQEKKVQRLVPTVEQVARTVAGGTSLEIAAQQAGRSVQQTPVFTRVTPLPTLGQLSEAVGAAFGLPVGAVSAPVTTQEGVFLIRVERRVNADRGTWEQQRSMQRQQMLQTMRQQRVREYMAGLRDNARIDDRRRDVLRQARAAA